MSSCAFCTELLEKEVNPSIGFNRVIWEDDQFAIVPTVGCFVEGYVMLMPKDHTYSVAQLDEEDLVRMESIASLLRSQLTKTYGDVVVAEHGAVSCAVKGAQCCDHAHLHFIPVGPEKLDDVCDLYWDVRGENDAILSLVELPNLGADEAAYILVSLDDSLYNVWLKSDGFKSQFCRWATAKVLGKEEEYDWRKFPHIDNMRKTVERLRGNLKFPSYL